MAPVLLGCRDHLVFLTTRSLVAGTRRHEARAQRAHEGPGAQKRLPERLALAHGTGSLSSRAVLPNGPRNAPSALGELVEIQNPWALGRAAASLVTP